MSLKQFLLAGIVICFGCKQPSNQPGASAAPPLVTSTALTEKLIGSFSGSFDKGLIRIVINYASGNRVSGFDIHKGRRRNLNGTLHEEGNAVNLFLKEPGDDPFDGSFSLSFDTATGRMKGLWTPADSGRLKAKKLDLAKMTAAELAGGNEGYDMWTGLSGGDTILTFKPDGSCGLEFYQDPNDSLSQLIEVRGNYTKLKGVYTVEWEKNTYTPAQLMKLKVESRKPSPDDDYVQEYLKGNGWIFWKDPMY